MKKVIENVDLTQYRTFGLTLLQLMGLLMIVGVVGAVLLNYWVG